jgi:putative lipoprotein (rSAM/lipoprotein system)
MKKLSEKSRRVLRRIYLGLGAATVSLLFQACYGMPIDTPAEYGMPHDRYVSISGVVRSKANAPIRGIKVSVKDSSSPHFTDTGGNFSIYMPQQESYKLKFEDIDGPENGGYFKTLKKKIDLDDTGTYMDIYLDEVDEE